MSDHEGLCQVWAHWTEGAAVPPQAQGSPEKDRAFAAQGERLARTFTDRPAFAWPERDAFDAETSSAMEAWHDGLSLHIDPKGVEFSCIPLLLDHSEGVVVIEDLEVARTADRFSASGWAPAAFYDELSKRPHVSAGMRADRAEIIDLGLGMRYVWVTRATLLELSATAQPLHKGTVLMTGRPGIRVWDTRPTGEVFSRYDRGAVRLAFPGTVEVF